MGASVPSSSDDPPGLQPLAPSGSAAPNPRREALIMGRRVRSLATLALATVGLVLLLAGGVAAKPSHCAKDCKQDIISCLALVPTNKSCTGTKAEKRACRRMYAAQRKACRGMVKVCKQQNPSLSGTCVLSSTTTTSTTTTSTTTPTTPRIITNTTTTSLQTTTTSTTPSTTTTTTTAAPTTTTTATTSSTTTSTTTTTTAAPTTTTTSSTTTTTLSNASPTRVYPTNGALYRPVIDDGRLYTATNQLYAFDEAGGMNCTGSTCQPLWTVPSAYVNGVTAANGSVFVTDGNGAGVQAYTAAGVPL